MRPRMVVGLALLLLAGCDGSKTPVSNPEDAKPDARLAGVWRFRGEDGQVSYHHIGQASEKLPAATLRVVSITHKEGRVEPPSEALMFPTSLGGNTYLNVIRGKEEQAKALEEKGWKAVDSYFICKYQVDGDKLLIWFMDRDAKKRAIETGRIKGVIEKRKFATTVKFTDTTENLARFVAQESDSLFSKEPIRLERVK